MAIIHSLSNERPALEWDLAGRNAQQNVCGRLPMLMTLFIMAIAVSGGLYLGTIAFSAYKLAEIDQAVELFQKIEFLKFA
jgi:hypothetical protein